MDDRVLASDNANTLYWWLANSEAAADLFLSPYSPTNRIAKGIGWGWHRTNNALKELGYR